MKLENDEIFLTVGGGDGSRKCRCLLLGAQYLVRYFNISLTDFKKSVKGRGLLSTQEHYPMIR